MARTPQQTRSDKAADGLFDGDVAVATVKSETLDKDEVVRMPAEPTDAYPFDGQPVLVTDDGVNYITAVWRRTRHFCAGRFQDTGFWSVYNSGGQRVRLHPGKDYKAIGYKPYVEPPLWSPPEKKAG